MSTALFHRLKARPGRRAGLVTASEGCSRGWRPDVHPTPRPSSRPNGTATWPRSPTPVRDYHATTGRLADEARQAQQVEPRWPGRRPARVDVGPLRDLARGSSGGGQPDPDGPAICSKSGTELPAVLVAIAGDAQESADGQPLAVVHASLAGTRVPRVALPRFTDHGELVRWLRAEHLPGHFPFTAGVFPFKREGEDPARMFAGEGDAFRTNRRFHLLADGQPATRLSTAFDSVTLYGFDPDERPDIYGKIGTSGVSIATLDDMQALFDGFDLCDPTTSVSMTINGPAPTILAMFFNAAIDQRLDRFEAEHGRPPTDRRGGRRPRRMCSRPSGAPSRPTS